MGRTTKKSSNYCEKCDKSFTRKSTLMTHLNTHKTKKTDNNCEFCHQVFKSKKDLQRHRIIEHANQNTILPMNLKIEKEDINDAIEMKVEADDTAEEESEVLVSCQFCEKGFTDFSEWRQHEEEEAKQFEGSTDEVEDILFADFFKNQPEEKIENMLDTNYGVTNEHQSSEYIEETKPFESEIHLGKNEITPALYEEILSGLTAFEDDLFKELNQLETRVNTDESLPAEQHFEQSKLSEVKVIKEEAAAIKKLIDIVDGEISDVENRKDFKLEKESGESKVNSNVIQSTTTYHNPVQDIMDQLYFIEKEELIQKFGNGSIEKSCRYCNKEFENLKNKDHHEDNEICYVNIEYNIGYV